MRTDSSQPLTWEALCALPLPPAAKRVVYGPAPQNFGQLRVPAGVGPFPIMVLVHGGCWRNRFDLGYMAHLAAWLGARGWATWTIEYRRLGDAGGGWPGTLLDAGAALDHLRELAESAPIDLRRVCVAGHSAGGQLALWLASRARLGAESALFQPDPLPVAGVLGLAAITDLDTYRVGPAGTCHAAVDLLMGGTPASLPQRYAESSPLRRLPLGVPQAFIHGAQDDTVSLASVRDYIEAATAAGDRSMLAVLQTGGHFDPVVASEVSEGGLLGALGWLRESMA